MTVAALPPSPLRKGVAVTLATVAVGVASGLGGMGLGLLLHMVQHVAFGYHEGQNFLTGVTEASPLRRLAALAICGVIAAAGRWAICRWGRPLVSITQAIGEDAPPMPWMETIAHDVLQIVTVALGSPLGREVAPRELGALLAGWLADRAALSAKMRRILIACGAGAGLAAVYNVPLGGALFTMEGLLVSFAPEALIPALATSGIAAVVAWIGLGNQAQYVLPAMTMSPALLGWAVAAGPLLGIGAYGFTRLALMARKAAPSDLRLFLWCLPVFAGIGLLAMRFPELLGNGKALVELGYAGETGLVLAATLMVLRTLSTAGALRAGGQGGLLTPALATGAMLAIVLGGTWSVVWPGVPLGAFAVVGSAAFLASSMRMPITAMVLVIEFTRIGHDFWFPMALAVAGSVAASWVCNRMTTPAERNPKIPSAVTAGE
jgi:H+/Cl- antiporter ClcA